ncbi:hypothetical protein ARMSODRAFT_116765 [Armillaria solidipes]|uniref:Uncharacterized protein n=1 Tax=Armillaria solidipes TaxID=1076256 RepID=A0A2H3BLL8_9AGAR|nr:hypothetical protein ARMSODRAFT_116765 [Armillaria solidipes]
MSTLATLKAFVEGLTTRRMSEMMLDENLRQLEVTIMKEYSDSMGRVPEYIETRSSASWAVAPAMEEQTRLEINEDSAEPSELVGWLVHHPQLSSSFRTDIGRRDRKAFSEDTFEVQA